MGWVYRNSNFSLEKSKHSEYFVKFLNSCSEEEKKLSEYKGEYWNLYRNITWKIIISCNKDYQHFVNLTFQCPFIVIIVLKLRYFLWEMSFQIILPFLGKEDPNFYLISTILIPSNINSQSKWKVMLRMHPAFSCFQNIFKMPLI